MSKRNKSSHKSVTARAPGKIIVSGEHSVVYGADAIAVAIDKHTKVTFTPVSNSKVVNTIFTGIATGVSYPPHILSKLKHTLDARFEKFSKGEMHIKDILNHPNDLAMYALSNMLDKFPSRAAISRLLPDAGVLRSDSSIPTGAGMGSSAAAIAATLVLSEKVLEKPLGKQQLFEMIRFCERLQHGKGSAIDAACVTFGGVNHIHKGKRAPCNAVLGDGWYWLNTGTPQNSTGECVSYVRQKFAQSNIWQEFDDTTQTLLQNLANPTQLIQTNQQLLEQIGIVSETAKQLCAYITNAGGSAKVSGAGTVMGENNGLVLTYLPESVLQKYSDAANIESFVDVLNTHFKGYIQSYGKVVVDYDGAKVLDT